MARSKKRTKRTLILSIIRYVSVGLILVSFLIIFILYRAILSPNVITDGNEPFVLYIPTGADYGQVIDSLTTHRLLRNQRSFKWLAQKKEYPRLVKPGRYVVSPGLSNLQLINMLRSGSQVPVKVTFHNIRTLDQLAGIVAAQIEADSAELHQILKDEAYLDQLGLDRFTAISLFIPNTYEFYWNTSAVQFIERMSRESRRFWDGDRAEKAAANGMTIPEVMTLASIVEKETNKNDEKARIAGVYINRLRRGWPLQADPTLVYATGDFGTTRVLNYHKEIDSPYNTYKYKGLPPGPICIPSIASIDASLHYEHHDYMFFVAKDDLSGYHVFSKTLLEHNRHAGRYRKAVKKSKENS